MGRTVAKTSFLFSDTDVESLPESVADAILPAETEPSNEETNIDTGI